MKRSAETLVREAQAYPACPTCGATAGDPCTDRTPGPGQFKIMAPHKERKK